MSGFEILSAVEIRASAALTSSFVAATVVRTSVRGYVYSVEGVYTRGASGGFCELQFEWSADGSTYAFDTTLNTTITASDPYFSMPFGLGRFKGPLPADGTAIRFIAPPIARPVGYDYLKVSAREGSGLTVGTLQLLLRAEIGKE